MLLRLVVGSLLGTPWRVIETVLLEQALREHLPGNHHHVLHCPRAAASAETFSAVPTIDWYEISRRSLHHIP